MAIGVLTIIFFAAGFMAMLYGIVAGFSMLKYMQLQKSLPDKLESPGGESVTVGPPEAEAFCSRARLLLKRQRFDAAQADCKRAIDLNPNHAVAHTLWELALASEVGLRVEAASIPVLQAAGPLCAQFGIDPLGTIASGALLLAVAPEDAERVTGACVAGGIACARIATACSKRNSARP